MTSKAKLLYAKKYRKRHAKRIKKWMLRYQRKNRKSLAMKSRLYRQNNPDKIRKASRKYYRLNKLIIAERSKTYRCKNKKKILQRMVIYNQQRSINLKQEVFKHYCGDVIRCQCLNCPITHISLLTIDHKNGDGVRHVSKRGNRITGLHLWSWLKRKNYPKEFQILCWSCNGAKGIQKQCPRYGKKH
jgi:hypothetical protein